MKAFAKNLIVIAFVTGSIAILAYYSQTLSHAPVISYAQPTVSVEPDKTLKTIKTKFNFKSCMLQAEKNHASAWELSCEQTFPETAQKYNTCITDMAMNGNAAGAAAACQSKCTLPETLSGDLDIKRDQAQALCRSQQQAAEQN